MQLEAQRGQTLPFWAIGVLVVLALMFFVSNAANALVWQVRAQNAADSAASLTLNTQANLWNEESTILYSAALDEYRIRYLNQALLNTINGVGCSTPQLCDSDYQSLLAELNAAVSGYDGDTQLMQQGNNFTEAGQQADQKKAERLLGGDCVSTTNYTCDGTFSYTVVQESSGGNGAGIAEDDVVACRTLSYFGPALLNLGSAATFQVVGRSAAAIVPANSEHFVPGSTNPVTGTPYQPVEKWASAQSGPAFDVDFTGLTVNVNWYTAGPIHPFGGTLSKGSYSC